MRMYAYVTLFDEAEREIRTYHSAYRYGRVKVRVEIPDGAHGIKEFECYIPSYRVVKRKGLSQEEVGKWVSFCGKNYPLLIKYAKCGGVKNA